MKSFYARPFFTASFVVLAASSSPLVAQDTAPPEQTMHRIEITANRSSGYTASKTPEYLLIWIQPHFPHAAFDPFFVAEAREAFGVWSNAGLPIVFDFTTDSSRANIHILWSRSIPGPTTSRSTLWTAANNFGGLTIDISLDTPSPLTPTAVRVAVMHEIGHLIGLSHVNELTSIMYYYTSSPTLSRKDVSRMHHKFNIAP